MNRLLTYVNDDVFNPFRGYNFLTVIFIDVDGNSALVNLVTSASDSAAAHRSSLSRPLRLSTRSCSLAVNEDSDVSDGSRSIHDRTGTPGPSSDRKNVLPTTTPHTTSLLYIAPIYPWLV